MVLTLEVFSLLFALLLCVSVIDIKTHQIPPVFYVAILCLGIFRCISDKTHLKEGVVSFVAVGVIMVLLYAVSKGSFMGGGDVKLICAVSLLIGWESAMVAILIACIAAMIYAMVRIRRFHAVSTIAFGPYLSIGILLSLVLDNCQRLGVFCK